MHKHKALSLNSNSQLSNPQDFRCSINSEVGLLQDDINKIKIKSLNILIVCFQFA